MALFLIVLWVSGIVEVGSIRGIPYAEKILYDRPFGLGAHWGNRNIDQMAAGLYGSMDAFIATCLPTRQLARF